MDANQIVTRLKAKEDALRSQGVNSLVLFGSHARGENTPGSDIDLMIEIAPDASGIGVLELGGFAIEFKELLETPVDLIEGPPRKPQLKAEIERDGVRVF